jgi:hypothetical protein
MVPPDYWKPNDENETCGIKNRNSVRLVGVDWTGLDSTLLVCAHLRARHYVQASLLPRLYKPDWSRLDSTVGLSGDSTHICTIRTRQQNVFPPRLPEQA